MAEEIFVCDRFEVGTISYEKSVSELNNYAFYKIATKSQVYRSSGNINSL